MTVNIPNMAMDSINADFTVLNVNTNSHDDGLSHECNVCPVGCQSTLPTYSQALVLVYFQGFRPMTFENTATSPETYVPWRSSANGHSIWKVVLCLHHKFDGEAGYAAELLDACLHIECPNLHSTWRRWWTAHVKIRGPDPDHLRKI